MIGVSNKNISFLALLESFFVLLLARYKYFKNYR